jgi:hypothetical protein
VKRLIFVVLLIVPLASCVSSRLNDGLQSLVGKNIQAAVARLGYPDGQRTMLGDTIYIWHTSQNVSLPVTTTSTTTGTVGTAPIYGSTTNTQWVPENFNCIVQIATDRNGTIKSYQWSGNMGGCERYASAFGSAW